MKLEEVKLEEVNHQAKNVEKEIITEKEEKVVIERAIEIEVKRREKRQKEKAELRKLKT